ncbi:MAG: hypothetical protein P8Z74_20515 [Acidobacteriota bacterium]
MSYYFYVLRSQRDDSYDVGQTSPEEIDGTFDEKDWQAEGEEEGR